MIILLVTITFLLPNKTEATVDKSGQTNTEYKYKLNVDYAPRFVIDATNKNYLLITFRDYVGMLTDSIEVYKYNSNTKKYDIKTNIEVLQENITVGRAKKTTIKILRKNISNRSENVRLRISVYDKDKNRNKVNGYLIIKPLTEPKNNKWFAYVNAPRMNFSEFIDCEKENDVLKKNVKVNFEDNKGIEWVKIYDLNSNTPKKEKVTLKENTSYTLNLGQYVAKKSPNGKDACKIRFEIKGKSGGKREEAIYLTPKKYEVIHATSLKLSNENINLNLGESRTIKATVKPSNTTEKIKYTTTNKNIVTVSQDGKIVPKKAGTATITAKVGNLTKTCKVTVKFVRSYEYTIYITV